MSSDSGTDGIGVVMDGTAVASRESIVMCPCEPVTAKSVTTSSRIVTLPSVEKTRSSKTTPYVPTGTLARAWP